MALQQAYADAGYWLLRVRPAVQDLDTRNLHLRVDARTLEAIDWHGAARDKTAMSMVFGARPAAALSQADVEQGLEQLARLRPMRVRASVLAGQAPDTVRLVLDAQPGPAPVLETWLTNRGQPRTGSIQHGVALTLYNALGLADTVSMSATANADLPFAGASPSSSKHQNLHISVPWAYWLGSLQVQSAHYQTPLRSVASSLVSATGRTESARLALEHVDYRDRTRSLRSHMAWTTMAMDNALDWAGLERIPLTLQSRSASKLQLGFAWQQQQALGADRLALELSQGVQAPGVTDPQAPALAGRDALGRKLNVDLAWERSARSGQGYRANVRLQVSDARLPDEDQLVLGGADSVRGALAPMYSAATGLLLGSEWQARPHVAAADLGVWQPYIGLDWGYCAPDPGQGAGTAGEASLLGMSAGVRLHPGHASLDIGYEGILYAHPQAQGQPQERAYFALKWTW